MKNCLNFNQRLKIHIFVRFLTHKLLQWIINRMLYSVYCIIARQICMLKMCMCENVLDINKARCFFCMQAVYAEKKIDTWLMIICFFHFQMENNISCLQLKCVNLVNVRWYKSVSYSLVFFICFIATMFDWKKYYFITL